jgi:hypothetical protein
MSGISKARSAAQHRCSSRYEFSKSVMLHEIDSRMEL